MLFVCMMLSLSVEARKAVARKDQIAGSVLAGGNKQGHKENLTKDTEKALIQDQPPDQQEEGHAAVAGKILDHADTPVEEMEKNFREDVRQAGSVSAEEKKQGHFNGETLPPTSTHDQPADQGEERKAVFAGLNADRADGVVVQMEEKLMSGAVAAEEEVLKGDLGKITESADDVIPLRQIAILNLITTAVLVSINVLIWYRCCHGRPRVNAEYLQEKEFKGNLEPVPFKVCPGCDESLTPLTKGGWCRTFEGYCCCYILNLSVLAKAFRVPTMVFIAIVQSVVLSPLVIPVAMAPAPDHRTSPDELRIFHQTFANSLLVMNCITLSTFAFACCVRAKLRTVGRADQALTCADVCSGCCAGPCACCSAAQMAVFIEAVERTDYLPESKDGNQLKLW